MTDTAQKTAAVKLRSVSFNYGDPRSKSTQIFNDFSFDLATDQLIALVGPSGCGKSTLLHLLAGIIEPTHGDIVVHERHKSLSYIFQEYPFLPRKTVLEHVVFPLRMRGEDSNLAEGKAWKLLDEVMLKDVAHRRVDKLSVGMKARVALSTALITKPALVLMDEPFHALDIETRVRMWELVRAEWRTLSAAGLIVTHDVNEAIVLADRVIVMSKPPSAILVEIDVPESFKAESVPTILQSQKAAEIYRQVWKALKTAFEPSPAIT